MFFLFHLSLSLLEFPPSSAIHPMALCLYDVFVIVTLLLKTRMYFMADS